MSKSRPSNDNHLFSGITMRKPLSRKELQQKKERKFRSSAIEEPSDGDLGDSDVLGEGNFRRRPRSCD